MDKIQKFIHKLAWTVNCQNPKFQNFDQSILASTGRSQNAYKTAKKWGKPPFSLLSKQDRRKRSFASLARAWPSFFGDNGLQTTAKFDISTWKVFWGLKLRHNRGL